MNRVEKVERAVQEFSPEELTAFRQWFAAFDAGAWDRQFEGDVRAGKLDAADEAALRNHAARGTARDTLETLFKSDTPARDKFLSRFFGIFNEEIVRCWCRDKRSPWRDLGRPTIKRQGEKRGCTLDFAFKSTSNKVYVGEMKCWLEYQNYRYLTLESPRQLGGCLPDKAFQCFLDVATDPAQFTVTIGPGESRPITVSGSILVWPRYTNDGRKRVTEEYKVHEVLSLESIIGDLVMWGNEEFAVLLDKYKAWTDELFSGLRAVATPRG